MRGRGVDKPSKLYSVILLNRSLCVIPKRVDLKFYYILLTDPYLRDGCICTFQYLTHHTNAVNTLFIKIKKNYILNRT